MQRVLYFLGELDSGDIEWFLKKGHKVQLPKGAVLIKEGQDILAMYILIYGQLDVLIPSEDQVKKIAHLRAGDIVGELSFLDKHPPNATVVTASEVTMLAIPRRDLERKLQEDIPFASRFYRGIGVLLSARLRRTVRRLGHYQEDFLEEPDQNDFSRHIAEGWFDFIIKKLSRDRRKLPDPAKKKP